VLIAWSRVFSGRWRDPLVGRDLLAGFALGAVAERVTFVSVWAASITMAADSNAISQMLATRMTWPR
jgi:hypothetical protein